MVSHKHPNRAPFLFPFGEYFSIFSTPVPKIRFRRRQRKELERRGGSISHLLERGGNPPPITHDLLALEKPNW